jgi:hypothetical protein
MADDKVTIWNGGLKFGRSPADGELLIGNGEGFDISVLSAGSGVTITNSAGDISISATGSGGTITSVTASSPLASSGGTTPNISVSGAVGAANGGTGQTSLTLNNVVLGNNTDPVQFVAPGAAGNLLTSNGTTWQSAAPTATWTTLVKMVDQAITSNNTTLIDVTEITFPMLANSNYLVRGFVIINHSSGGAFLSFNGPSSPTQLNAQTYTTTNIMSSFFSSYGSNLFAVSVTADQSWTIPIGFFIKNGSTAGNFYLQFRQFTSSASPTTMRQGSYIEYQEV